MDWYLKVLKIMSVSAVRGAKSTGCLFWSTSSLRSVLGLLDKNVRLATRWWRRHPDDNLRGVFRGGRFQFRRLHDTNRSAWWALLFLIPFIGWLIIIVFNCRLRQRKPLGTRSKTGTLKTNLLAGCLTHPALSSC